MARYRTTFVVTGTFSFPLDMLRCDSCYPSREKDAGVIEDTLSGRRARTELAVQLEKTHEGKDPHITPERWASFSCS